MVAEVSPEKFKDFRQAAFDRHLKAMSLLVERARSADADAPCCTLILRSAASAPAHALTLTQDALLTAGIRAKVIVAHLEPAEDLRELFATLTRLSPDADHTALMRWARNPRLLDAHEQVTYGHDACWSGDAMRRDAETRNPLALFESEARESVLRAAQAFKALWGASTPVPRQHLNASGRTKPLGAFEQPAETPVTALKPLVQGWPLVRH